MSSTITVTPKPLVLCSCTQPQLLAADPALTVLSPCPVCASAGHTVLIGMHPQQQQQSVVAAQVTPSTVAPPPPSQTVTLPDGAKYTGELVNGKPHGKEGAYEPQTVTLADGWTYTGELVDGVPNGRGKGVHKNDTKYDGEWRNGMFHGFGRSDAADGLWWSEGTWVNDKRHGVHTLYDRAGGVQERIMWRNGQRTNEFVPPEATKVIPPPTKQVPSSSSSSQPICATKGHDLTTEFTLGGVLCGVLLFPIGLICCCVMRQHRCKRCGTSFSNYCAD